ncbi:MAG: damage-inducible protein, partial [Rhodovulum sulfidophilum]
MPPRPLPRAALADLRLRIADLERGRAAARPTLPFGLRAIDAALPGGGLALGALHEIGGGGDGALDGA